MTFVSYAQNFEDVILWRALRDVTEGHYIDIGAQDPVVDSVSLAFYEAGWRGIHVEATPFYAAKLREARPDEIVIEAAVTDECGPIEFYEIPETGLSTGKADVAERHAQGGFQPCKVVVPCVGLDKLFEMATDELHWMKIDVEGMEPDVLRSWRDSAIRPWVLVIESTFPNSLERSEHLWLHDVLSRGYREAYFDGLSRYFVHEAHQELTERLATPPNVFDAFHVASTHFSSGMLNQLHAGEVEQLRMTVVERESQVANEIGGLHRALESASTAANQARESRAAATQALAISEREHRNTIDRMWRDRQDSELAIHRERLDVEQELRGLLSSSEVRLREDGLELAALRERAVHQQEKIEFFQLERDGLRQHLEARNNELAELRVYTQAQLEHLRRELQEEAAERTAKYELELEHGRAQLENMQREIQDVAAKLDADRDEELAIARAQITRLRQELQSETARLVETVAEREALAKQLGERDATVGKADQIIRKALVEPLTRWQRLGRALAFFHEDGTRRILRSWDVHPSETTSPVLEFALLFALPGESGDPDLRANSLAELLSWHDVNFVRCAYVTVLGRQPDSEGEAYYTQRLRRGHSKMQILSQLRRSNEGQQHDPGIPGFDRALVSASKARIPLIGKFFGKSQPEPQDPDWAQYRALTNQLAVTTSSITILRQSLMGLISDVSRLAASSDVTERKPDELPLTGRVTIEQLLTMFEQAIDA